MLCHFANVVLQAVQNETSRIGVDLGHARGEVWIEPEQVMENQQLSVGMGAASQADDGDGSALRHQLANPVRHELHENRERSRLFDDLGILHDAKRPL